MTLAIESETSGGSAANSHLLTICEVASWQISSLGSTGAIRAALPALQRGAVWHARQVEELWDSLLRGFPVGAFLLAPFDDERGTKTFRYAASDEHRPEPTHHLLDGQQRSNAIALGFWKPWSAGTLPAGVAALWLDLEAPSGRLKDDREFVLRLLTRAHPWGYRWDRMADGGTRLTAQAMREASAAYKQAAARESWTESNDIPVTRAWPWDAKVPVPLSLLIDAVMSRGDVRSHLLAALQALPFWSPEVANIAGTGWTTRVGDFLGATSGPKKARMDRLIEAVAGLVADLMIQHLRRQSRGAWDLDGERQR
jgi:hypothetical protein